MTVHTQVSQGTSSKDFSYIPLDLSDRPSIRLAILHPGGEFEPIRLQLVHATFADRPKYEALSYTWGSPSNSRILKLNGSDFSVGGNLWEALIHLRHPEEARTLWVDAICINQEDIAERSHQVRYMKDIYFRAKEVLVWLGRLDGKHPTPNGIYSSLDGVEERQCFERWLLSCSKYWTRVWIVQEIAAASSLSINWGVKWPDGTWVSKRESWDTYFPLLRRRERGEASQAMILADQRENRYGDDFLLANIMEACRDCHCTEPRDMVYGFVSIAHDCQDGTLPIDYSKSLFEIYEDVMKFQHRTHVLPRPHGSDQAMRKLVHFSELVQSLLRGSEAMSLDFQKIYPGKACPISSPAPPDPKSNVFMIEGLLRGSIHILGPSFDDIVALPDATRKWTLALSKCKTNMSSLRRTNEDFLRTLLDWQPQELRKIRSLSTHLKFRTPNSNGSLGAAASVLGLKPFKRCLDQPQADPTNHLDSLPLIPSLSATELTSKEPRLFATEKGVIGLVPSNAKEGDLIFQFWNAEMGVVARLEDDDVQIIGTATIANKWPSQDAHLPKPVSFIKGIKGVYDASLWELYVDILTLQAMTG